jgi:UDPglucose--hexose-1-phosphate uridylyltransferase
MAIFHPHSDVQHIKRENIGLIEVMGLAILPGRLKTELEEVKRYILGEADTVAAYHQPWAEALKQGYQNEAIDTYMQAALRPRFLDSLRARWGL